MPKVNHEIVIKLTEREYQALRDFESYARPPEISLEEFESTIFKAGADWVANELTNAVNKALNTPLNKTPIEKDTETDEKV